MWKREGGHRVQNGDQRLRTDFFLSTLWNEILSHTHREIKTSPIKSHTHVSNKRIVRMVCAIIMKSNSIWAHHIFSGFIQNSWIFFSSYSFGFNRWTTPLRVWITAHRGSPTAGISHSKLWIWMWLIKKNRIAKRIENKAIDIFTMIEKKKNYLSLLFDARAYLLCSTFELTYPFSVSVVFGDGKRGTHTHTLNKNTQKSIYLFFLPKIVCITLRTRIRIPIWVWDEHAQSMLQFDEPKNQLLLPVSRWYWKS